MELITSVRPESTPSPPRVHREEAIRIAEAQTHRLSTRAGVDIGDGEVGCDGAGDADEGIGHAVHRRAVDLKHTVDGRGIVADLEIPRRRSVHVNGTQ